MTICYNDRCTAEAILMSRIGNRIRVAMPGAEDVIEFREINGTWFSEASEPVTIEFALDQIGAPRAVTLEDCICPPELTARLVTMLYDATRTPELERAATIASTFVFSAGSFVS